MKKVYLVTSGQYSDFGVDSVHSTRAKAEEWMKQNKPDGRVGEWELNPVSHPKGWRRWVVEVYINGDVREVRLAQDYEMWDQFEVSGGDDDQRLLKLFISGVNYNEKKVIKIANERRILLLATIGDWANLEEGCIDWEKLGLIDPNKEGAK